jgi:AhpD family alkylhydroperoxidase
MLPAKLRYWLFDVLSMQTMRYVSAVPRRKATGLTREVYDMIAEDFFRNGSLTSRSGEPELLAAIWTAGRESMLVPDKVDRTTKDALCAVLSQINDCPYCGDMLISLVYAAGAAEEAGSILREQGLSHVDDTLHERLEWTRAAVSSCDSPVPVTPFNTEQLPEVIATIMAMSDINRYSHVVMDGSPVKVPFGLQVVKDWALKMFSMELRPTRGLDIEPGRALPLLPAAELPADMQWAAGNQRVADAMARYAATVERVAAPAVPAEVQHVVNGSLANWQGEQMPLDTGWIDSDVAGLSSTNRAIAKLAIVLAKAPYRVTDAMAADVLDDVQDQQKFVRILAWTSFTASRRLACVVADNAERFAQPRPYSIAA